MNKEEFFERIKEEIVEIIEETTLCNIRSSIRGASSLSDEIIIDIAEEMSSYIDRCVHYDEDIDSIVMYDESLIK